MFHQAAKISRVLSMTRNHHDRSTSLFGLERAARHLVAGDIRAIRHQTPRSFISFCVVTATRWTVSMVAL